MKLIFSFLLTAIGLGACFLGCGPIGLHRRALAHEAANVPIDLSVPGEYRAEFNQDFRATHGKQFRFEMEPRFETADELYAAMEHFKATLLVRSESGETLLRKDLSVLDFQEDRSPGCRWHAPLDPFTPYAFIPSFDTKGDPCILSLTVKSPATDVGWRRQRLVSKNVLCQIQSLGGYLCAGIIVIGLCLISAGVLLFRSFVKSRRSREPAIRVEEEETPPSQGQE